MELQTNNAGKVHAQANMGITLFASAARDTDEATPDLKNHNFKGVTVIIDVTAESGTHAMVVTIQGKDPASGAYYTILQSASITGIGTTFLRVYPSIAASANVAVSDTLPADWKVDVNHTKTASSTMTYSIGAQMLN